MRQNGTGRVHIESDFDHDHVGLCKSSDAASAGATLREGIGEKLLDAAEVEWLKKFDEAYPDLACDDSNVFSGGGRSSIDTIASQIADEFRDLAELASEMQSSAITEARRRHQVKLGPAHGRHKKGMYRMGGRRDEIFRLLNAGKGIREVHRITGASKDTVAKARRVLVGGGMTLNCECGQPSTHQGWCHVRLRLSPVRQAVLAAMHQRQLEQHEARVAFITLREG